MLEKVTVTNINGQKLEMELRHPEKSGYAVTGITGIQPVDVDIKTSQFVSGKKFKYNAGFHKLRNIGINIIFYEYNNSHKRIETLRDELYEYFMTNSLVTLTFYKSGIYYSISGVVDKNQPTIFAQATGASISITCPELWFYLSDSSGTPISSTGSSITYAGNMDTGFICEIQNGHLYNGHTLTISSYRVLTNNSLEATGSILVSPTNIDTNQSIYIDITHDNLEIYTINSGVKTNRIDILEISTLSDRGALPYISVGSNQIKVMDGSTDITSNAVVTYNTLYRGL